MQLLLMSTYNMIFHGEIRTHLYGYRSYLQLGILLYFYYIIQKMRNISVLIKLKLIDSVQKTDRQQRKIEIKFKEKVTQ